MKTVVQEALGYTAVSGCALLVDMTMLWVLVHYFSWWYLAAAMTSFSAGLLIGYVLCVTTVFNYRRLTDRRLEFGSFAAIGAVGRCDQRRGHLLRRQILGAALPSRQMRGGRFYLLFGIS